MPIQTKNKNGTQSIQRGLDKNFESTLLNYQYAKGIEFFEKYFYNYPFLKLSPRNLVHLGLLYDHAAMTSNKRVFLNNQARQYYRSALSLDPGFYPALWGLGRIFWHQNDKRSLPYARKAYHLAKKRKDDTIGHFAQNIALIYKGLGNNRRAIFWFKRGLKESPQEWGMVYNLMCFYLETRRNKQESRNLARKLKSMLETKDRNNRWLREVHAFTKIVAE